MLKWDSGKLRDDYFNSSERLLAGRFAAFLKWSKLLRSAPYDVWAGPVGLMRLVEVVA